MPRQRCQPPLAARQGNHLHHYRRPHSMPDPQQLPVSHPQGAITGGDPNAGDIVGDTINNQLSGSISQPVAATVSSTEPFFSFSRQPKRKRPLSPAPLQSLASSGENEHSQTNTAGGRASRRRSRATEVSGPAEFVEDHEGNNPTSSDIHNQNTNDSSSSSANSSPPQPHEDPGFGMVNSMPLELLRQQFTSVGKSAAKMIHTMQSQMTEYIILEKQLSDLINEKCSSDDKLNALLEEVDQNGYRKLPVVRLNVGGELFTVPVQTLLGGCRTRSRSCGATAANVDAFGADEGAAASESSKDENASAQLPCSFFHALLNPREGDDDDEVAAVRVFTDSTGALFIDRDPETFRHVLNYLRGYTHFQMLEEDQLRRLKTDARYYGLPGLLRLLKDGELATEGQFQPGPGVNPERNRLRVMYGVAVVGDAVLVTGRHRITYEVITADYVGVGLISDSCVSKDQEFHKTSNSCVYYMSGVFYSNFPYHRKEENLEKIENGDFISILVDMDKGFVEYTLKNFTKMISIGRARRLRFAVTMKVSSRIRIVQEDEAMGLLMHKNR